MVKLLDPKLQELARDLVRKNKVILSKDAEKDVIKCNYSEEMLKKNFDSGVLIEGKELYNNKPEYHNRNYCISCYSRFGPFKILGKFYNNLAWNFTNDKKELIIFIHTSPCSGHEKKIYKLAKNIKEPCL